MSTYVSDKQLYDAAQKLGMIQGTDAKAEPIGHLPLHWIELTVLVGSGHITDVSFSTTEMGSSLSFKYDTEMTFIKRMSRKVCDNEFDCRNNLYKATLQDFKALHAARTLPSVTRLLRIRDLGMVSEIKFIGYPMTTQIDYCALVIGLRGERWDMLSFEDEQPRMDDWWDQFLCKFNRELTERIPSSGVGLISENVTRINKDIFQVNGKMVNVDKRLSKDCYAFIQQYLRIDAEPSSALPAGAGSRSALAGSRSADPASDLVIDLEDEPEPGSSSKLVMLETKSKRVGIYKVVNFDHNTMVIRDGSVFNRRGLDDAKKVQLRFDTISTFKVTRSPPRAWYSMVFDLGESFKRSGVIHAVVSNPDHEEHHREALKMFEVLDDYLR